MKKIISALLLVLSFSVSATNVETESFTIEFQKSDMVQLPNAKFMKGTAKLFVTIEGDYPQEVINQIIRVSLQTSIEETGAINNKAINQQLEKELGYWLNKWELKYDFWYVDTQNLFSIY